VIAGRVAYLMRKHGVHLAAVWFVKLVTDPLTDIAAYAPRYLGALGVPHSSGARRDHSR